MTRTCELVRSALAWSLARLFARAQLDRAAARSSPPRCAGPRAAGPPSRRSRRRCRTDLAEQRFPGGAALKTDPEQQRLLKRAEQCVEDGRLDLAAVLWQKVLDEAGDTLMTAATAGTYYVARRAGRADARQAAAAGAGRPIASSADGEAQALIAAAGADGEEEALATGRAPVFPQLARRRCGLQARLPGPRPARLRRRQPPAEQDPREPSRSVDSQGRVLLRLAVASCPHGRPTAGRAVARRNSPRPPGLGRPARSSIWSPHDVQGCRRISQRRQRRSRERLAHALGNPARTGHMTSLPAAATSRTLSELWVHEFPLATVQRRTPGQQCACGRT